MAIIVIGRYGSIKVEGGDGYVRFQQQKVRKGTQGG